jgi:guanine deaminase
LTQIIHGNFLFTKNSSGFTYRPDAFLLLEDGIIKALMNYLPEEYLSLPCLDFSKNLIIPGFCDLHTHAPQFMNCGTGYDEELIPWLEKYTFPTESRFCDNEFAQTAYKSFFQELWRVGTTRACVFGTLHREASEILFSLMIKSGIGGYVGKVNMDRNSIPSLSETTEESIAETEKFLSHTLGKSDLVKPILTPRFVPSTTEDLMTALGQLAEKYDLPIQSHVSENRDEVLWVRRLHPNIPSFSEVYDHYGLLRRRKTILAHAIYLEDREKTLLKNKGTFLAHCPLSNCNMASGIMPLSEHIDTGMLIGLGSDVSGGHRLDMMSSISGACEASNLLYVFKPQHRKVSLSEAFYLATKGGGSFFGKVGSFEEGYEADFLVLDPDPFADPIESTPEQMIGRFVYSADSTAIRHRFVRGKEIFIN